MRANNRITNKPGGVECPFPVTKEKTNQQIMATSKTIRIDIGQYTMLLWYAFCCCILLFASCSKDYSIEEIETGVPIRFSGTVSTKASVIDQSNLSKIGVFGYYTGIERWEWSAAAIPGNLQPDYFLNEPVTKVGGIWGYNADYPRYWSADTRNKISFFAYAPYFGDGVGAEDITNSIELYPTVATETGTPSLTYTVPDDALDQVDLLWGASIDASKDDNGGIVRFDMNHALTKVSFSALLSPDLWDRNNTIEITKITISGVHKDGMLDLSTGQWILEPTTGDFTLSSSHLENALFDTQFAGSTIDESIRNDYESRVVIKDDCYLMMLPQQMTNSSILSITLNITTVNIAAETQTETIFLDFPLLGTIIKSIWEQGNSIEYNFTLKQGIVDFNVNVRSWEDEVLPSILY